MSRGRSNKVRRSVSYPGLFGEKRTDTWWEDRNTGCGTAIVIVVLLIWVMRGC